MACPENQYQEQKLVYACISSYGALYNTKKEWYKFDLEKGEMHSKALKTLQSRHKCPLRCKAVALGSVDYVFGGSWISSYYPPIPHGYLEVAYSDTRSPHDGWKVAPSMVCARVHLFLASMNSKIYSFDWGEIFGEVFDTNSKQGWKCLEAPDSFKPVSDGVVADPSRGQILAGFRHDGLSAYYPDLDSWKVLDAGFSWQSSSSVIVGDVLYYLNGFDRPLTLCAFNLVNNERLEIVWVDHQDMLSRVSVLSWDAILHLGNEKLCLCTWEVVDGADSSLCKTAIYFAVVEVREECAENKIVITVVSFPKFTIEGPPTMLKIGLLFR